MLCLIKENNQQTLYKKQIYYKVNDAEEFFFKVNRRIYKKNMFEFNKLYAKEYIEFLIV